MVIKAVFFDWFNTLARYEPPREETAGQVLKDLGYDIPVESIRLAIAHGDRIWFEENTRSPIRTRSREEQARAYVLYQQTMLRDLGIDPEHNPRVLAASVAGMRAIAASTHFVLFDDVLPALTRLRASQVKVGVLTNLDRDMVPISRDLGLESYVDLYVTSGEIGVDKPDAAIFIAALQRAGVKASEAIHVGDQYAVDVVGARGVGITGLLIDRFGTSSEAMDCPKIRSLGEVAAFVG
jgi:HAD superfamily hydrolase (TIGR01549 family)